jgi:hypothetical protein
MFIRISLVLLILPLWGLSQSVKYFTEKNVDWNSYRSFSVGAGELVTVLKAEVDKEKILAEIRQTITDELESRGLQHKPDGAQMTIEFTGEIVETTNVEQIGPLGQEPADEPGEMDQSKTWTQERKQGSLAIELFDAKSKKSIWRSSASMEFGGDDLAVVFNAAIGKSLRKFPLKK